MVTAQLSQRDRAAGWVSVGQKWKTGTGALYSVSQKSTPPAKKTLHYFHSGEYSSMKFCQCVASLYLHTHTHLPIFVDLS